jgi:hypothetical protein
MRQNVKYLVKMVKSQNYIQEEIKANFGERLLPCTLRSFVFPYCICSLFKDAFSVAKNIVCRRMIWW